MPSGSIVVDVSRLRPGLFVDLELSWHEHPFIFSKFKLKSAEEIRQIKSLGLTRVRVLVSKSQSSALKAMKEAVNSADLPDNTAPAAETEVDALWAEKKAKLEQADKYRREHRKSVQRYRETQKRISNLSRDLKMAPANAVRDAESVIDDITSLLDAESSVMVTMVNLSSDEYSLQHHALNVTVLALVLGKQLGLSETQLKHLGVGCILHDIGMVMLPQVVVMKTEPLTSLEESLLKTHVQQGLKLIGRLKDIPPEVYEIIAHHHCFLDGTGYPANVAPDDISQSCRILQIANHYDTFCNPKQSRAALSPKLAMAKLFAEFDGKLDNLCIHNFVRNLGVYPPGTVVQLSDGSTALVTAVDSSELLAPTVLVYNPEIPANQALMIKLAEQEDLSISHALKRGEYPARIHDYLGITDRVGFFIGSGQ